MYSILNPAFNFQRLSALTNRTSWYQSDKTFRTNLWEEPSNEFEGRRVKGNAWSRHRHHLPWCRHLATMKRIPVLLSVLFVIGLAVRAGAPVFLPHASQHFSPLSQVTDDLPVKLSSRYLEVHVVGQGQRRFSICKRLPSCSRRWEQ